MKFIYIIRDGEENLTAYSSMTAGVTAAINRLVICGYMCRKICFGEYITKITYTNDYEQESTMFVEKVRLHEEGD